MHVSFVSICESAGLADCLLPSAATIFRTKSFYISATRTSGLFRNSRTCWQPCLQIWLLFPHSKGCRWYETGLSGAKPERIAYWQSFHIDNPDHTEKENSTSKEVLSQTAFRQALSLNTVDITVSSNTLDPDKIGITSVRLILLVQNLG